MNQRQDQSNPEPRRIRKYANRRLYDTEASAFVTLTDLAVMVKSGREFVVEDVASGTDLTSSVLIQIIAEQEANGEHLLPLSYLRQLIGFYGEDAGQYLTGYLEQTLQTFVSNQQQLVKQFQEALGGESPIQALTRHNMDLFKSSMQAFASLSGAGTEAKPSSVKPRPERPTQADDPRDQEIEELRATLAALSERVNKLGDV